jgi:hypothetical protein
MDDEDLDYAWIEEFKNIEQSYDKYYKSIPNKITSYIIFINKNNEVDHLLANQTMLDKNGIFAKEKLISLINKYKKNKRYHFIKILKYNITVDPININKLIDSSDGNTDNYMTPINNIQSIKYHDTIKMLHNINALFVLYREKSSIHLDTQKQTRRRNRKCISKTRKMPCKVKHT